MFKHPEWFINPANQRIKPFTPRVSYGELKVILPSESVDEILWCDHSNETSSAVLSHGTIYIWYYFQHEI